MERNQDRKLFIKYPFVTTNLHFQTNRHGQLFFYILMEKVRQLYSLYNRIKSIYNDCKRFRFCNFCPLFATFKHMISKTNIIYFLLVSFIPFYGDFLLHNHNTIEKLPSYTANQSLKATVIYYDSLQRPNNMYACRKYYFCIAAPDYCYLQTICVHYILLSLVIILPDHFSSQQLELPSFPCHRQIECIEYATLIAIPVAWLQ